MSVVVSERVLCYVIIYPLLTYAAAAVVSAAPTNKEAKIRPRERFTTNRALPFLASSLSPRKRQIISASWQQVAIIREPETGETRASLAN